MDINEKLDSCSTITHSEIYKACRNKSQSFKMEGMQVLLAHK